MFAPIRIIAADKSESEEVSPSEYDDHWLIATLPRKGTDVFLKPEYSFVKDQLQ